MTAMRDFGDDAEAIDGHDDFFDGVDDFSDDDGVRHDGWREDEPDTINVEQTSPLPAPASLESAGEIEDDDDDVRGGGSEALARSQGGTAGNRSTATEF